MLAILSKEEFMGEVCMSAIHERFVVDKNGKRTAVLLDVEEYQKLLQGLEELDSLKAYNRRKHPRTKPPHSNKPSQKSKRPHSAFYHQHLAVIYSFCLVNLDFVLRRYNLPCKN